MTDEQWRSCNGFEYMLDHLGVLGPGPLPADKERRLRLLACAACRRIWHLLDDQCQEAVDVAERHADGFARPGELQGVRDRLERRLGASHLAHGAHNEVWAVFQACETPPGGRWALDSAGRAVAFAHGEDSMPRVPDASPHYLAEYAAQADLIRDLYGDSPKRRVGIPLAWYTWGGGIVRRLAEGIYDERAFDRMPALGDALAGAGCDQGEILSHCRSGSGHARGCWVVDAILGRW